MIKFLLVYFLIYVPVYISAQDSFSLTPAAGFPQWLKTSEYSTDQTSGIAFIKTDANSSRHFLLADDTGTLHHLIIIRDSLLALKKIFLSSEVKKYIEPFPKKDFEEIMYDRFSGRVFLSVEGNSPVTKKIAGIYEIKFINDDVLSDSVISINKLNIQPEDEFLKYISDNVCFEGLASDENYYYAALEGFSNGIFFADSTVIYIINKKDYKIKKILSTRNTGIETICGLYSDKNFSLYGVDRNNKNFFHIEFTDSFDIKDIAITKIFTSVPNYKSFDYVVSLESLTIDNDKNVYLVDDPWKQFYIPAKEILIQLDEQTIRNFKSYVPVIYKFKLNN